MAFLNNYFDGEYEITEYTISGNVRDKDNKIVACWDNYWTSDGSIHEQTQKQLDNIKNKFGITIIPSK